MRRAIQSLIVLALTLTIAGTLSVCGRFLLFQPRLLQDWTQQGQQRQCRAVIPARPPTGFVFVVAGFLFADLNFLLDRPLQRLLRDVLLTRHFRRRVRAMEFCFRFLSQGAVPQQTLRFLGGMPRFGKPDRQFGFGCMQC